jgi:hypothetical protein
MKNELTSDSENLKIKSENKNKNNNKSLKETFLEKNEDREIFSLVFIKSIKKKKL